MVLPVRETSDEPDAPATKIDNCPVTSPAAFGAKFTVIVELCPGVRVKAANGAERAKPGPVTTILLTVTLPPLVSEELVTITEACRLSFTATAPKSRLAVLNTRPAALATADCCEPLGLPPHEAVISPATITNIATCQLRTLALTFFIRPH